MLSKIWKKIYPRIFRNPCDVCLVKSKCKNTPYSMKQICILEDKWLNRQSKIVTILNDTELYLFIFSLILGTLLIILTFVFGLWKWFEIGKKIIL